MYINTFIISKIFDPNFTLQGLQFIEWLNTMGFIFVSTPLILIGNIWATFAGSISNIFEIFTSDTSANLNYIIPIDISLFMDIGLLLCFIGIYGILLNIRNILVSIISIEIMFYGINFYLIIVSLYQDDFSGQVLALFILTIAAAESAIALALLMSYFKIYRDILFDY